MAAVAAVTVLCLLGGLRFRAYLHSAALATLVLQRALWHGDAACALTLWRIRGRAARSLAARADHRMGASLCEIVAASRHAALRRQLHRDDVPHSARAQRGDGQLHD